MSSFDAAISFVLQNEGGLVSDPHDVGGLTNFGISQSVFPNEDIRNMTRERACELYRSNYWRYDDIVSQRVATKLFDAHVNMGPVRAVRLMQLALGAIQAGPVVADGVIGSHTVEAINAADEEALIDEYKAQLVKYYFSLNQPEFLTGWIRRAVKG